ncbi:Glycosyl hydrolases family 18 [Enhydrobacter aerosaccus]|uniref:Glycosyl hydrolases family 18 n=1 Tax=Enhydrobacter aerosaccus TaxID=225324 RepID=A0A1T4K8Z9_9HYPH|nr:carbohydrate-binding protein [Enhydrobacter aerosaccus]SJZ38783.1 Glycosyl hydrolases family 18 [Enhydrobacter aerosaccus]
MTTTAITWAWGTNTQLNFNPATDTLNFGWFQGGQFTVAEVNGSVVISIPSNNQTYTLENVTLSQLHLSNIVANDSTAISEWTTVLNGASSGGTTTGGTTTGGTTTGGTTTGGTTGGTTTGGTTTGGTTTGGTTTGGMTGGSIPAWSSTIAYTAGMEVTENGVTYVANWWNKGTDPAANSGIAGASGVPWTIVSGGSTQPAAWSATSVYTAGQEVVENGVIYKANWWTEGSDPATHTGSGQPWTVVGATGSSSESVPTVPVHLASTATTASAAVLSWDASTVPGGGTVTNYAVYENGHQVGTTTGTSYTVTGLTANTDYQFSVAAIDLAGSSAQSSAITVHTAVATSTGGTTTIAHEFSPYIDMSMGVDADLSAISKASGVENFTLAFVLSSSEGIGWGGTGSITNDTLSNGTTIQHQVEAIQAAGGNITISFGGANGQEPALTATSASQLQAEYQSVIDRYHVNSIDFDIEGAAVSDQHSITLRDAALVGLEAANPNLKVTYTLPVLPTGLDANGLNVLQNAVKDGVKVNVVNIMAMDYGPAVDNGGQMGQDAINAVIATEKQLASIGLAAKIGVTVMIGVNDVAGETFTLADAQSLVNYAKTDSHVVELSMWSMARDNGNTAGAHYASPDSSGVAQTQYQYSSILHQFEVTS